jgi:hypothetical protein
MDVIERRAQQRTPADDRQQWRRDHFVQRRVQVLASPAREALNRDPLPRSHFQVAIRPLQR